MKSIRYLGIAATLASVVGLVIGIVFIVQSVSVKTMLTSELAAEKSNSRPPGGG